MRNKDSRGGVSAVPTSRATGESQFLLPYGSSSAAQWAAMFCQRHMYEYGTTQEQLGTICVTQRRHAAHNPLALFKDPLTLDEYHASRWISRPFHLYDCDVPVDMSIAFVVSAADVAADLPHPAIRLEAAGMALRDRPSWDQIADPATPGRDAAAELWAQTDLTVADVDVAELYDGFSILTLMHLESLGFCGEGEGGPFVEGGQRITFGGDIPLNTDGGHLSAGRSRGFGQLLEACVQLRGEAGDRQVPGAEVALAGGGGGPVSTFLLFTRAR